jgi:glycosyltransferase involved in cell wall biosynthesis
VLPSLADNLPNALLESMGLGKVVVGTKGSSFDEVIEDGKDGFLVDAGNVNKLAEKIIEVWKMQDIKPIEQAASAKSRDFRPETVISELVKYYEMIINKER